MSVRLKGTETVMSLRWIPKYTGLERTLHWVHTACFLPLALTGYVLFAPWLQPIAQGEAGQAIRMLHRVTAVIFGLVPIIYIFFQPRRAWMNLKEFLTWGKDDWEWLKAHDWNACRRVTVSRVRIPLSPPKTWAGMKRSAQW